MPKLYAIDLIELEEKYEALQKEKAALEAASPIIRRLKRSRLKYLDRNIYEVGMLIVSGTEIIRADPTSQEQYEIIKRHQKEREDDHEPEP